MFNLLKVGDHLRWEMLQLASACQHQLYPYHNPHLKLYPHINPLFYMLLYMKQCEVCQKHAPALGSV